MATGVQGDNEALRRAVVQSMARKVAALRTTPGPRKVAKMPATRGRDMSLAMAAKQR